MLETISLALSHTVEGWNCLAMVCGAAWGIIGGAFIWGGYNTFCR